MGPVTNVPLRLWLLGTTGVGALGYVFVMNTLGAQPGATPTGFVWPLLGVLPLFGIGLWLATVSESRQGLYVLLGGWGMAVDSAHEVALQSHPAIWASNAIVWVSAAGLLAGVVSTVCGTLAIASFPDGEVEHEWQRRLLSFVWIPVAAFPLAIILSPTVPMSAWLDAPPIPNPYAAESLAWAAPLADVILLLPVAAAALALVVFVSRAVFGDPATRAKLRFMAFAAMATTVAYGFSVAAQVADRVAEDGVGVIVQVCLYLALLSLPVAFIHGILRYGAFGVASPERARIAIRASWILITVLYAVAVTAPALLLANRLSLTGAVILTVTLALALQPARTTAEAFVRRVALGDRDKQLTLMSKVGSRLERTVSPDDVFRELGDAIADGLSATWVRVRLLGDGDGPPATPTEPARNGASPTVVRDLVHAGQRVGRIELGPRRTGDYSAHDLELLDTVARQASAAAANVRLSTQLADQLAELTASRVRLVAAQDEERRRIERNLHDGIQQSVVALIAGLRLSRNRLGRGQLTDLDLAELQDQARETLADLRELAHGIHPQVLTDNGLVSAVESRTARFPIPLTILASDHVRHQRWSTDTEAIAFYTVREALANVAKHSQATHATVTVSTTPDTLRVEIHDDGSGFDAASRNGSPGGLANIRDRVGAVGGRVTVTSTPGHGTRLVVDLPVDLPTDHPRETAGV